MAIGIRCCSYFMIQGFKMKRLPPSMAKEYLLPRPPQHRYRRVLKIVCFSAINFKKKILGYEIVISKTRIRQAVRSQTLLLQRASNRGTLRENRPSYNGYFDNCLRSSYEMYRSLSRFRVFVCTHDGRCGERSTKCQAQGHAKADAGD